jgi:hypothetical protein
MEVEISPEPTESERRAIAAALWPGEPSGPYASRWRAAALDGLRGDVAAEELRSDARVVEP